VHAERRGVGEQQELISSHAPPSRDSRVDAKPAAAAYPATREARLASPRALDRPNGTYAEGLRKVGEECWELSLR